MKLSPRNWKSLPLVLIVLAFWAGMKFSGLNTAFASVLGMAIVIASVGVLMAEFFKSGDIGLNTFGLDLAFSVLQVIAYTAIVTALITRSGFTVITVPDVLLGAITLADAWFGPFNSFRTALRNFAVGGPSSPGDSQ